MKIVSIGLQEFDPKSSKLTKLDVIANEFLKKVTLLTDKLNYFLQR